jgi:Uma2 family endonuclease
MKRAHGSRGRSAGRGVARAAGGAPWYNPNVVTPSVPSAYLASFEDWLALPDDYRCELIDGEWFMSPSPNTAHQRVSRDLAFILIGYLRYSEKGELFPAPLGVRLDERSVLEPDLLIVLREHAARVGTQVVDGPPDLVVEILSPGSARRDLRIKREKYRSTGVPLYWIVDPINARIEVLVLENGDYLRFGMFGRSDTLRSGVLADLAIALCDVFPAR